MTVAVKHGKYFEKILRWLSAFTLIRLAEGKLKLFSSIKMIDDEHENVNGSVGTTSKLSRHFKIKPSNVAKINLKERTPQHEHQQPNERCRS